MEIIVSCSPKDLLYFLIGLLSYSLWFEKTNIRNLTRVEEKLLVNLIRDCGLITLWLRYIPVQCVNFN